MEAALRGILSFRLSAALRLGLQALRRLYRAVPGDKKKIELDQSFLFAHSRLPFSS